ncbi:tyrosine-type recombinase/integrase [Saccharopolyspora spinosa]|uniref:Site-specific recombinase XerD n=1 Tax=Saccharopolyspora spinosa TaxID=60894 RepID=A0A2N3XSA5_SACSN|nr:site-specific integrase [Saccharopolyspora spinosa]PKW13490.1 site-specific recombinase XerD [Saccharopolyspora spinosa]PKW19919.1 site-specific recombinase XerD [Saccharopolyspora spinosa]
MADIDDRWHRTGPDGKPERTDRYGIGARWLVRWRDPDGRQRKKSFRRKVDAEQYATTIEHGLLSGTYIAPDAGKIMVEEWATKWLDAQAHVKPTTLNRSAGIVRTHILPTWGKFRLSDITHAAVQSWVGELSRALSPASVAKVHRVLSLILAWGVRNDRLAKNPAEGVNLPRVVAPEHRYLSHRQVADLADACDMDGLVVLFLAYTGLRWGEMAALRVHRVDLDRRRVLVAESVTEVSGRLVWGTPKNHERRSVPLPRFVAELLGKHLVDKVAEGLVFTAPQGGVLRVRNFRRAVFNRAVAEVGPVGFHPHELRHTAASLAIASGADVKIVQQMLGHKSATMTLDQYGHLFPDRLNEIADRMDAAVCAPNVART